MIVGVPTEIASDERRVALVPQVCGKLAKLGLEVRFEAGAGQAAGFADADYQAHGARLEPTANVLFAASDIIVKVRPPARNPSLGVHEVDLMKEGTTLISFLFPAANVEVVRRLAARKITSFAMDLMPRITRAQSMDALSSMSSIAGYKAVLLAAGLLPRYFPMLMTAAGTITPARVLVLGAGVAGLQAIATAKRLGAVVEGFDIRSAVKEQVESLGARFIDLDSGVKDAEDRGGYAKEQTTDTQARIRALLGSHVSRADVVITTALVPGKRAPVLVTADMVRSMRAGSVIVDLAAEQGGNCEGTVPGQQIRVNGVVLAGPLNLPAELAVHASELYARNLSSFLEHLCRGGSLQIDLADELTKAPLVTRDGEIVHALPAS